MVSELFCTHCHENTFYICALTIILLDFNRIKSLKNYITQIFCLNIMKWLFQLCFGAYINFNARKINITVNVCKFSSASPYVSSQNDELFAWIQSTARVKVCFCLHTCSWMDEDYFCLHFAIFVQFYHWVRMCPSHSRIHSLMLFATCIKVQQRKMSWPDFPATV